ncbi:hypothetical protein QYH69_01495 [Paraburkholderia sp. SARCC-3016]|uniref:hypothetical protein n=1 Tax=Paraburkholderia sp. SARCC-3016 TaxID=3058611 RepID=UPI002806A692|nr:hypothetical protein [Paraburkholderia sp. SARCC-3016]MDQ7975921.1 hypothetical protein [Paraburkholderia sp. SARCC-3016]
MFGSDVEKTVIGAAIVLWFAHGWYLNTRLERVHAKLDAILNNFDGLRNYLYEIDPQFDDERMANASLETSVRGGTNPFAGIDAYRVDNEKREQGKRTLNTPFADSGM